MSETVVELSTKILDRVRQSDGSFSSQACAVACELLTKGYASGPSDDELWPRPDGGGIDPDCENEPLASARAIVAIEIRRATLLTEIVTKRLAFLRENPKKAGVWLDPILRDEAGQCLLTVGLLAGSEAGDWAARLGLFRDMLAIEHEAWHSGPLGTLRRLGVLLRDKDASSIEAFALMKVWPGWSADHLWPIRLPGDGLKVLTMRATDFVADALTLGEAKLWKRGSAIEAAVAVWPPLDGFCWGTRVATNERGGQS